MSFSLRDAQLEITQTLPDGEGTAMSASIDLGNSNRGSFVADCELLVEAPALDANDLPDGETMVYDLFHDDDPAFGTEELLANVITQTGAGGAGALAAESRYRFPTNVKRYIRIKATNSGTGDASDKSLNAGLRF